MAVNDGTLGSSVSFSQIQTFYGGSNPISLSEYYRGGAEVPSASISGNNPYTGQTSGSGNGNGAGGNDGITVGHTPTTTTTPGSLSVFTWLGNRSASTVVTMGLGNRDNIAYVDLDANTSFARVGWSRGPAATATSYPGNIAGPTRVSFIACRGPAWRSGDSGLGFTAAQVAALPQYGAGRMSIYNGPGNSPSLDGTNSGRAQVGATVTTTTHAITFTNNTGQHLNVTSVSPGSASSSVAPGATFGGGSGLSSNAWSFAYNYIDAGSGSGTGDETNAGVVTDVTTTPGMTTTTPPARGSSATLRTSIVRLTGSYTVQSTDSILLLAVGGGDPDSGTTLNYEVNGTRFSARDGNQSARVYFGGPAGGYTTPSSRNTFFGVSPTQDGGNLSAGDVIRYIGGPRSSAEFNVWRATTTTTSTTHDVTFRNTNADAIILSPSSTGGSRTLTSGQTAQVINDGSSSSWSFQYRLAPGSQPANTALPSSGTINADQFNAPGNAAP